MLKYAVMFGAAALSSSLAASTALANTVNDAYTPITCISLVPYGFSSGTYNLEIPSSSGGIGGNGGELTVQNTNSTNTLDLLCPIVSHSGEINNEWYLGVYQWGTGTTGVRGIGCSDIAGVAQQCASTSTSSTTGNVTITVSTPTNHGAGYEEYIYVLIGAANNGTYNALYGIGVNWID